MEVKTLLRLIKDDIAHLNGITDDFFTESLLLSDEVELALVRAKALLRELELLHKFTVQHDNSSKLFEQDEEPKDKINPGDLDQDSFEMTDNETLKIEKEIILNIGEGDPILKEEEQNLKFTGTENFHTNEQSDVLIDNSPTETYQPAELVDVVLESPIINEDWADKNLTTFETSAQSVDDTQRETDQKIEVNNEASGKVEVAIDETVIITDIQDYKEEIIAEEFAEVKKTLNETLGEAHQMVNDILSPEKTESGYRILPINSIWEGIGINDRFLYIRELFANSSTKFETTIAALDQLSTINDAVNYLKMNFKWNKSEASQKFLVLVKRRFTK